MIACSCAQNAQNARGQSPIDIRAEDVVKDDNLSALQFMYGTRVTLEVVNTGSPKEAATIRAHVPVGAGQLRVGNTTYNLVQFHWHTPSEHLLDGADFPLEMHLVHQAADDSLLVVGIFIEQGNRHATLDAIFANLPQEADAAVTVNNFNLHSLLPVERGSFRYNGSLTTPTLYRKGPVGRDRGADSHVEGTTAGIYQSLPAG